MTTGLELTFQQQNSSTIYADEESQRFLALTQEGKFIFVWEAVYDDGKTVKQFDEIPFYRTLMEEDYSPPDGMRLSVDALERDKVVEFRLWPAASFRKRGGRPVVVKLKGEERFVSFFEVDLDTKTGKRLYRHVVGIEKNGMRVLTTISPSGWVTLSTDTNVSFEGE